MAATVKQIAFLDKLAAERNVPDAVLTQIYEIARMPDARPGVEVSAVISRLMAMPKKAVIAAAAPRVNPFMAAGIPCARYVLDRAEVAVDGHGCFNGNQQIFLEVAEYKGTRYMRKLTGAPGSYSRSKVSYAERDALIAALVAVGPLTATQRYSTLYSICSCCGAELTEDHSRAVGMGPTCRKRFGL